MLKLPNIHVVLNTDYRDVVHLVPWKHVVYTGPVDAFFDCRYRRLPYRSLVFKHVTLLQSQAQAQPLGTPNHPNDHAYTRASEFKHLTGQQHPSTSLVYEYPQAQGDPYYPVPRPENAALYKLYEAEAEQLSDVTFLGAWPTTGTATWTKWSGRRWWPTSAWQRSEQRQLTVAVSWTQPGQDNAATFPHFALTSRVGAERNPARSACHSALWHLQMALERPVAGEISCCRAMPITASSGAPSDCAHLGGPARSAQSAASSVLCGHEIAAFR